MRRLTQRAAQIAAAYRDGEKLEAIAAAYAISRQRVEQIARSASLPHRRPPGAPRIRKPPKPGKIGVFGRVAHEERNRTVIAWVSEGRSLRWIAERMGLPFTTVRGVAHKFQHMVNP